MSIHDWQPWRKCKTTIFYPADCTEVSSVIKFPKNHKPPGIDGLTAEILNLSPNVIVKKNYHILWMKCYKVEHFLRFYKPREWYRDINPQKNLNVKSTDPYLFFFVDRRCIWTCCAWAIKYILDEIKLFNSIQFGLRSKLSPIHALSDSKVIIMDNCNLIFSFSSLEIQKAFVTTNHGYLMYKLEAQGVTGVCLNWSTSYLCEGSQCYSINGELSKPILIDCGIQQGYNLGPLLFSIYVDEFPNSCEHNITFLFADVAYCFIWEIKM